MQNTVQNSKSVRLGSGVLKLSGTDIGGSGIDSINIGAVDSAGIEAAFKTIQVKFKNAQLEPRTSIESVVLKSEMVELDINKLKTIFGGELSEILAANNTETGNDRKILTFSDIITLVNTYEVSFENTDADGKVFGVKILKGYSAGSLAFDFGDDDNAEEYSKIALEFKGLSNSAGKMFEIFDEQGLL